MNFCGYFGTTYAIEGGPNDPPHTVLLAQHEGLYVGAWIIHEPTSESAAQALCR